MYTIHNDINSYITHNKLKQSFAYDFLKERVAGDESILEYQLTDLLNKIRNDNSDFANIIRLGITKDIKYLYELNNISSFVNTLYIWRHTLTDEVADLNEIFLKMTNKLANKDFYIVDYDNCNHTDYHEDLIQRLTYMLYNIEIVSDAVANINSVNAKIIFDPVAIINSVKKTHKNDLVFVTYISLFYNLVCKKPKLATTQGNKLLEILFTTDNKATKSELNVYVNLIALIVNSNTPTSIFYRRSMNEKFNQLCELNTYKSVKDNNVKNYIDLIKEFYKYNLVLINMIPGIETDEFDIVLDIYLKNKYYNMSQVLKIALNNIDCKYFEENTNLLVDILTNKLINPKIQQIDNTVCLSERLSLLFNTFDKHNSLLKLLVKSEPDFISQVLTLQINDNTESFRSPYRFNILCNILPELVPICLTNQIFTNELMKLIGYKLHGDLHAYSKDVKIVNIVQAICDSTKDDETLKCYYEKILNQYLEYNQKEATIGIYPNITAALQIMSILSPIIKRLEKQDTLLEFCKKHHDNYTDLSEYLLDDEHKQMFKNELEQLQNLETEQKINEFLKHNNLDQYVTETFIYYSMYNTNKKCIDKIKDLLIKKPISEFLFDLNSFNTILSNDDMIDTLKRYISQYENNEEKL